MKRILTTFTLVLFALVPFNILAQGSVAFVYSDSILLAHSSYSQNMAQIDSISKIYKAEVTQEQEALNKRFRVYLGKYNLKEGENLETVSAQLSPADSMLYKVLLKEQSILQEKINSYNNILQFFYAKDIDPIIKAVSDEIERYSKKNKIDVVFMAEKIAGTHAYLNSARNITPYIIERLAK